MRRLQCAAHLLGLCWRRPSGQRPRSARTLRALVHRRTHAPTYRRHLRLAGSICLACLCQTVVVLPINLFFMPGLGWLYVFQASTARRSRTRLLAFLPMPSETLGSGT